MRFPLPCVLSAGAVAAALAIGAAPLAAEEECQFVRGDVVTLDPSGTPVVDLNDGVAILAFLFVNRSAPTARPLPTSTTTGSWS